MKKFLSRKFISWILVFSTATAMLWFGKIDQGTWLVVASAGLGIYTAVQGIIDFRKEVVNGK